MRLGTVISLWLLAGCASLQKDQTVCPEYRNLRCATPETCSMDASRGCRVCRCDVPMNMETTPDRPALPPEQ